MGLDQFAYVAAKTKNDEINDSTRELAYWRKHPNLQGWMEQLWIDKGGLEEYKDSDSHPTFNGIEVELTWQDIEALEQDVVEGNLPSTTGFFFGNESDDYYKETDLEFVRKAKAELFCGLRVFYNSSW